MKKLAIAAIVAAVLAVGTSGAALYRTRHLSSSKTNETPTSSSAALVEVPDTTNTTSLQAGGILGTAQLKFTIKRAPSNSVAKNSVISQDPAPATLVPPGTSVELTVSTGPAQ